jgi:hypothetical protein
MTPQPKPHTVRDAAYLAWLRTRDCSWCGRFAPSEAAHQGGGRGTGIKGPDTEAVPLCRPCHRYQHQHGVMPDRPVRMSELEADATRSGAGLRAWAAAEASWLRAKYLLRQAAL